MAKFSTARYDAMVSSGILTSEDKVELLENYVVLKMPRNPRHDSSVRRVMRPLLKVLPSSWDLWTQLAVTFADSQPEPDFAVVRGSADDYELRHPSPDDIGLLIEVADSSLLRDQRDKTRIYARAGVPIYWIINLVDRRIEVFSKPSGPAETPGYAPSLNYQRGDEVPLVLDGAVVASIPVAELLP